ncbi:MAG: PASTA domain-containing protein [Muribaculaceae bacterium]|nr:PASTA domain-containing protein [Muribaculaceae bacterium]
MSNNNAFDSFKDKHPFLLNGILMVLAFFLVGYIALLFIDVFTSHGQERRVPDVRNLPLEQAIDSLENAGFKWDISDSTTFYEQYKPGVVIDQDPQPLSYIKAIRTIYLKVNAMHARSVKLPKLTEISVRQGLAALRAHGFKHVQVDSIASPYQGLILQVTANGRAVAEGATVSVNAIIRLTVGDGSIKDLDPTAVLDDSTINAIEDENYKKELEQYNQSIADENNNDNNR